MSYCNIDISAPEKILKGAGILNSKFLPLWINKIYVHITNNNDSTVLSSFNVVLPNGIRYLGNIYIDGPDKNILDEITIVIPNKDIKNDTVIIFANNINLSPKSKYTIILDVGLCDKFTKESIENSGDKIPHKHKLNFSSHLLYGSHVSSSSFISEAADYIVNISCEDCNISVNEVTKFYIECKTGQYDMVKNVYFRNILGDGLQYVDSTSNIEPYQIYPFDKKTILKWEFGTLKPGETRKIGYKAKVLEEYKSGLLVKDSDIISNYVNSNCVNNTTYNQCPDDDCQKLTIT